MIYLIHCKNFYKCHHISPPSPTIKKKIWRNLKKKVENGGKTGFVWTVGTSARQV
jgi:hypothetical protein